MPWEGGKPASSKQISWVTCHVSAVFRWLRTVVLGSALLPTPCTSVLEWRRCDPSGALCPKLRGSPREGEVEFHLVVGPRDGAGPTRRPWGLCPDPYLGLCLRALPPGMERMLVWSFPSPPHTAGCCCGAELLLSQSFRHRPQAGPTPCIQLSHQTSCIRPKWKD